ncbi:MAG: hypothetical protein JWM12_3288 [Ilumatobacteraceae bacterium]|nr:hypothetical protein [Ilumatobacteraceae bacterium]
MPDVAPGSPEATPSRPEISSTVRCALDITCDTHIMRLLTTSQGPTLTRYWLTVHLGPYSRAMLVDPADGTIVTAWTTGEHSDLIHGVWLSPIADLVGEVEGFERELLVIDLVNEDVDQGADHLTAPDDHRDDRGHLEDDDLAHLDPDVPTRVA